MTVSVIKLDKNQFGIVCDAESLSLLTDVFGSCKCGTEDMGWFEATSEACTLYNVEFPRYSISVRGKIAGDVSIIKRC